MSACPKCGSTVEHPGGRGRPAIFCSVGCRSSAAYEIRRITTRLEHRESRALTLRHAEGIARDIRDGYGRTHAQQLAACEAEIAEDEARLRLLLSEGRGKPLEDKPEEVPL